MKKNRFKNKNVVITGGSSGIGLEIAKEFAKLEANIFLIARNKEKLRFAKEEIESLHGSNIKIVTYSADISIKKEIEKTINSINEQHNGIHTLINNAGETLCGYFEDNPTSEIEDILDTNYLGSLYATKTAWNYIKNADQGHIGFVSSVAGFTGLIGYAAYAPSKFAITGLAECLRMEAKQHGIGVSVIFPPDTETSMLAYEHKNSLPETLALSKNASTLKPDFVAKKFVKGIINNKFEIFCNIESIVIRIAKSLIPNIYYWVVDIIAGIDKNSKAEKLIA